MTEPDVVGGVGGVELVDGAGEGYRSADGCVGWIGDLEAKVAGVALGVGRPAVRVRSRKR